MAKPIAYDESTNPSNGWCAPEPDASLSERGFTYYVVTTNLAAHDRVAAALKTFALIHGQGYADGSTSWRFLIEVEETRSKESVQQAVWDADLANVYVAVRAATEEESDYAQAN